nr:variable large family protein [Borrelia hermsii]
MLSGVKDNDIDKLINEIKSIVDVILKEGNADAGNDKRPKMVHPPRGAATNDKTGKLFITTTLILLLMPRNQQPTHQRLLKQ